MLADAIANFFLLVVTDVMITLGVKNHGYVIMADLFLPMWFNYGHFIKMTYDVAIVADEIFTSVISLTLLSLWTWNSHIVR